MFWVSVPVLSDAITVVEPRVSTAGSVRTIACRFAMRATPTLIATVRMMGSDSGIEATDNATAVRNISDTVNPPSSPAPKVKTTAARIAMPIHFSRRAVSSSRGVLTGGPAINSLMAPSSVRVPIATTTPVARPPVTKVPLKAMQRRSPIGASAGTGAGSLATAIDSPVSIDSSTCRPLTVSRRRSAGT